MGTRLPICKLSAVGSNPAASCGHFFSIAFLVPHDIQLFLSMLVPLPGWPYDRIILLSEMQKMGKKSVEWLSKFKKPKELFSAYILLVFFWLYVAEKSHFCRKAFYTVEGSVRALVHFC